MPKLKENLEYLSKITGKKCEEGNFEQITNVASNLYVNGRNYIGQKDWDILDEEKLNTLCSEMQTALKKGSGQYVACIKWNDPWAEPVPVFPEKATEEEKNEIINYWKTYEEKKAEENQTLAGETDGRVDELIGKLDDFFLTNGEKFWNQSSNQIYGGFSTPRERNAFLRLVLMKRGVPEEEVFDQKKHFELKTQIVAELREVLDPESSLNAQERAEKLDGLLTEAETAFNSRRLKAIDLNDLGIRDNSVYNKIIYDEMTGLLQIEEKNKDRYPELINPHYEKINILNEVMESRSTMEMARSGKWQMVASLDAQDKIDREGYVTWKKNYQNQIQNGNNKNAKRYFMTYMSMSDSPDAEKKMDNFTNQYDNAKSAEERANIHQEQLKFARNYREQWEKYIQRLNKIKELLGNLKKEESVFLINSSEFNKLKKSLEEAAKAEQDQLDGKMQEVYENAKDYISKKGEQPRTSHGKKRLGVAKEIRDYLESQLKDSPKKEPKEEALENQLTDSPKKEQKTEIETYQKEVERFLPENMLKRVKESMKGEIPDDLTVQELAAAFIASVATGEQRNDAERVSAEKNLLEGLCSKQDPVKFGAPEQELLKNSIDQLRQNQGKTDEEHLHAFNNLMLDVSNTKIFRIGGRLLNILGQEGLKQCTGCQNIPPMSKGLMMEGKIFDAADAAFLEEIKNDGKTPVKEENIKKIVVANAVTEGHFKMLSSVNKDKGPRLNKTLAVLAINGPAVFANGIFSGSGFDGKKFNSVYNLQEQIKNDRQNIEDVVSFYTRNEVARINSKHAKKQQKQSAMKQVKQDENKKVKQSEGKTL